MSEKQAAHMRSNGYIPIQEASIRMFKLVQKLKIDIDDGLLKGYRAGRAHYVEWESFCNHAGPLLHGKIDEDPTAHHAKLKS